MPLPHDDTISKSISNGEWLDMQMPDMCYFIHTFEFVDTDTDSSGRPIKSVRVYSNQQAVKVAYHILNKMSADFINVHNGFGFDLKTLVCAGSTSPLIASTFDERRLGKVGTGVGWKIKNGSMFTDSLYTTDKKSGSDFVSLSLDGMAKELGLPRKIASDSMAITPTEDYNMNKMAGYNTRNSDMHVWVCKKTTI